jgi:hypothetical protein
MDLSTVCTKMVLLTAWARGRGLADSYDLWMASATEDWVVATVSTYASRLTFPLGALAVGYELQDLLVRSGRIVGYVRHWTPEVHKQYVEAVGLGTAWQAILLDAFRHHGLVLLPGGLDAAR